MTYSIKEDLIAKLPVGWGHRRLKEVADVVPSNVDKHSVEGQAAVRLCNYVDTYKNERITSSIEFMQATATSAQIERLSLKKGDITITKDSESPWDIAVPAYIAEDMEGLVCGYHLSKISPADGIMDGGYLSWALRSRPVNVQFALSAQGITRYGLSSSGLADGVVPMPPLEDQIGIASYLDAETKRIDGLIEEKRKLLDYLQGMRSAIIVSAMLSGSKPDQLVVFANARWMGRIPADWKQMTLTRVVESACDGPFGSSLKSEHYTEEGVPVIRLQNIGDGEFLAGDPAYISEQYFRDLGGHDAMAGDMVVASLGDEKRSPGRACVVPNSVDQALVKADCFRFRLDENQARADFVAMLLNSLCRPYFQFTAKGTTRQRVTITDVRRCPIALPSLETQKHVVETVSREQEEVARLIAHVEQELTLLSELRAVTITDAVLGRIDVREHMKN